MADEKDKDKKEIKDLEEQLFKEFNEHVNLSEPSDSRLQDNVDLNPQEYANNPEKEAKSQESEETKEKAKDEGGEEASKQPENPADLDLGDAFQSFVETEQVDDAIKSEEAKKAEAIAAEKEKNKPWRKFLAYVEAKLPLAKQSAQNLLSKSKELVQKIISYAKKPYSWFMSLSKKHKLYFVSILAMSMMVFGSATYVYYNIILTWGKSPYLTDFSEVADASFTFDKEKRFEDFFSKAYMPDYTYVLPKIVTNLRPSRSSGSNPMIFIEIILQASNEDTAIELKDREIEFKDRMTRVIEEYKFDLIKSENGKVQLKKDLKNKIDPLLNDGFIEAVLFKSFIVKP